MPEAVRFFTVMLEESFNRSIVPEYCGMHKSITTIIRDYATDYPAFVKTIWAHVSLTDGGPDRIESWPKIFDEESWDDAVNTVVDWTKDKHVKSKESVTALAATLLILSPLLLRVTTLRTPQHYFHHVSKVPYQLISLWDSVQDAITLAVTGDEPETQVMLPDEMTNLFSSHLSTDDEQEHETHAQICTLEPVKHLFAIIDNMDPRIVDHEMWFYERFQNELKIVVVTLYQKNSILQRTKKDNESGQTTSKSNNGRVLSNDNFRFLLTTFPQCKLSEDFVNCMDLRCRIPWGPPNQWVAIICHWLWLLAEHSPEGDHLRLEKMARRYCQAFLERSRDDDSGNLWEQPLWRKAMERPFFSLGLPGFSDEAKFDIS